MPEKKDNKPSTWVLPLSVDRVKTSEKGHETGPFKLCEFIDEKILPHDQLCVHVGDTAYFTRPIRERIKRVENLVYIARIKNNRTLYHPYSGPNKKKYGAKMQLGKVETHRQPDEATELSSVTAKGRQIKITIKVWRGLLFRGSQEFRGYENPIDLYQICQFDEKTGKKLFKRPIWLAVDGKRRNELSLIDAYESYKQRDDLEHFFRFGKQKLLIASFQTPDVTHEETWWNIAQIAYTQLYLGRDLCQATPHHWEKYLPKFKEIAESSDDSEVSPSLAQRSFSKVLEQIGTPAHEVRKRKPGKGRQKGDKQEKRDVKPIIFKGKKNHGNPKSKENGEQKETQDETLGLGNALDSLKPKNKKGLIDILIAWLPELNITPADLMQSLESVVQT